MARLTQDDIWEAIRLHRLYGCSYAEAKRTIKGLKEQEELEALKDKAKNDDKDSNTQQPDGRTR